mgnify:CR=1 FL=1
MKNKVIVFDLDGTLLGANNEIIGGTETLNCLDSLQQMGWTLAICTGRLDHDILNRASYFSKRCGLYERTTIDSYLD